MSQVPNKHGFNLLGHEVACIDCEARGYYSEWPDDKQAKHRKAHIKAETTARQRDARRRAREARRLATQARSENELAYGKGTT